MDDVWFGQGATDADVEAYLNALSLEGKQRPPLLAVATAGKSPRLLLASRALFGLFGVATGEALSDRLLHGHDPGAERLVHLCRHLTVDGAPRLERLRFFLGPGTEIITFLCRRIPGKKAPIFIAAALGVRTGLMTRDASPDMTEPDMTSAGVVQEDMPSTRSSANDANVPPALQDAPVVQEALRRRWPDARNIRFLWQSDVNTICTNVTSALADIVGDANADLIGRDLIAFSSQIDPSGQLAGALASKSSWSDYEALWPIADTAAAVPVGLGAIALFDSAGAFEGYRGFGVLHLDKIKPTLPVRLTLEPHDKFHEVAEITPDTPTSSVLDSEQPYEMAPAETFASEAPKPSVTAERADDMARHASSILERLTVGILVSRDNVPIYANRHLLDILGFADEDELHAAGGVSHLFAALASGAKGQTHVGVRCRDGQIIPANVRMQAIDWDGLPTTLLTLQHLSSTTEASLARINEEGASPIGGSVEARELRAILETATDGVAVIDADGTVISLNRSGEALFGCDRSTVIGRSFLSLFAPHNQGLAADYLDGLKSNATQQLLNDGREFLVNAYPGGTIPVFMTLGRLGLSESTSDGSQSAPRFCALFRDLTHWKKVETDLETARHEAERANALKSDFLAKVSHEIRTPLNAIIGFAEMMLEERFGSIGNARYTEYLRDIQASGTHVMSLVNDLLDLSKIEAGKMELVVDAIDANKVIAECVAIMQPQASRARIIMRLSLAPTLPHIKADARSLRQIVLNLLSNAVKFNEPGGQVIVATTAQETGHVVIRIRDTGPGMSAANIEAALEPFRQLPTARPTAGTGLGLPLTKALVEANQAALSIRSKVDQGTLVEVAFPPARVLAN